MDIDHNELMEDISRPSKYTKERFMNLCPGVMPVCEQELEWWMEWWENNPDEQANSEIAFYEHCKKQSAEYFCHKLFLREFLEEHSIRGIGDFYLHVEDKKVTIKPIVPTGKKFEFKL